MTNPRRQAVLLGALAILLLSGVVWSHGHLTQSRAAAIAAADDLAECRRLVKRIRQLKHQPVRASSRELQMTELAQHMEEAAQAAQLPVDQLDRIAPEPARRVGESAYKEKLTRVDLREVTLRQLISFLHQLSTSASSLRVHSIRLSAPHEQGLSQAPDRWNAQIALTYLIYEPVRDQPAGRGGT